jgi:hypothetical protein
VDDYGNIFFPDLVPPEQSQYRLDSLSKTGKVIEATEKAKTKEQLKNQQKSKAYVLPPNHLLLMSYLGRLNNKVPTP